MVLCLQQGPCCCSFSIVSNASFQHAFYFQSAISVFKILLSLSRTPLFFSESVLPEVCFPFPLGFATFLCAAR